MGSKEFLSLRLTGDRFDGHAIPLEFLKNLSTLNEMLINAAKLEFLADHPTRQRSSPGFTHGIELKLTAIKKGSATLKISLTTSADSQSPPVNQVYFERALDTVVTTIETAAHNQHAVGGTSERMLRYFGRLGRSLREEEVIEFTTPTRSTPTKLTKEICQRLIPPSPATSTLTVASSTRPALYDAGRSSVPFDSMSFDTPKIEAPIAPQLLDELYAALKRPRDSVRFRFEGIGRFSRTSQPLDFDLIEHISVLDPLDVPARLDEFRSMKDGWLEDGAVAPPHAGLDWLADSFERQYPDDVPLPHTYPTYEGGVRMEWSFGPNAIVLNVNLDTHRAHWLWFDRNSDAEREESLNLDEDRDWAWLARQIRSKAESE